MPTNAVVLEGNVYEGNLIGSRRSVSQVEAVPIFVSKDEIYKENHNWCPETFNAVSPLPFKYVVTED